MTQEKFNHLLNELQVNQQIVTENGTVIVDRYYDIDSDTGEPNVIHTWYNKAYMDQAGLTYPEGHVLHGSRVNPDPEIFMDFNIQPMSQQ